MLVKVILWNCKAQLLFLSNLPQQLEKLLVQVGKEAAPGWNPKMAVGLKKISQIKSLILERLKNLSCLFLPQMGSAQKALLGLRAQCFALSLQLTDLLTSHYVSAQNKLEPGLKPSAILRVALD